MYMIQIELEGGPACTFPASDDYYAAIAVFLFIVENLKSGRRVRLLDESGNVEKAALSGDTKKLGPEFP